MIVTSHYICATPLLPRFAQRGSQCFKCTPLPPRQNRAKSFESSRSADVARLVLQQKPDTQTIVVGLLLALLPRRHQIDCSLYCADFSGVTVCTLTLAIY